MTTDLQVCGELSCTLNRAQDSTEDDRELRTTRIEMVIKCTDIIGGIKILICRPVSCAG